MVCLNRIVPTTPISATGAVDFPRVLSGVFRGCFVTAPLAPIGPIEPVRCVLVWACGRTPRSRSGRRPVHHRIRQREALSDSEGASGRRPSRARLAGDLANRLKPPAGTSHHPARAISPPIERRAQPPTLPKQDRRLRSSPRSRLRPQTDNLTPAISIRPLLDQAHLVGEPNPKRVRTFF